MSLWDAQDQERGHVPEAPCTLIAVLRVMATRSFASISRTTVADRGTPFRRPRHFAGVAGARSSCKADLELPPGSF